MTEDNMTIFHASFTVTITHNITFAFEAPDAETADRMMLEMEGDEEMRQIIAEECEINGDGGSVDEVEYDEDVRPARYQLSVDDSVNDWCREWLQKRTETAQEDAE